MKRAVICFTKVPQAGKSKTRLNKFMSGEDSAALNSAFLRDISAVLAPYEADVFIAYTPEGDHQELRRIFPYATAFFAQKGGDLGERMHNAMQCVLDMGYDAAVLTGADLPLLKKEHFDSAFEVLEKHDVTFGPSGDGGYYLVGLKKVCPELFENQPYGKDSLYESSLKRAEELGLSCAPAIDCSDVDTAEDLYALIHSLDSESHTAKLMDLLGLGEGSAQADGAESFPFWDELSGTEKNRFADKCVREFVKRGSGVSGDGLMLVCSGALRAYIVSKEGRELNLYHLNPGDLCLLADGSLIPELDFPLLYGAEEDTQLLSVSAEDMKPLMAENSEVALFVYREAARRFSGLVHILQKLMFEKLDKRLAKYLLEEAERGRGRSVVATHDTIACEIGSAREVVSKTLKQMAKNGLIELGYNRIEILDVEALRNI